MYKHPTIRYIAAAALLLLFALSITPKQILHNVITGHKHNYIKFEGTENIKASKNNFQCSWPEQLVESPFTDQPGFRLQQPVLVYASYINHYTFRYYATKLFFSSLRGPPSHT